MLRAGQSARGGPEEGDDLKGRFAAEEDGQGWYQPGRRRTYPEDSDSAEGQHPAVNVTHRHSDGESETKVREEAFRGSTILRERDGDISCTLQSRCAVRGPGEQSTGG